MDVAGDSEKNRNRLVGDKTIQAPKQSKPPTLMYLSIRHFKAVKNAQETTRVVNELFFPLIRAIPGFVSYYGIETADGGWASINVFETAEGAAESNKVGIAFAHDQDLNLGEPEIIAGAIIAHTAADNVSEIMTAYRQSLVAA